MKEYGGFLPLELPEGHHNFFQRYDGATVLEFDCARNALVFLLTQLNVSKIHIPYYNCEFVKLALEKYGIPYQRYFLDDALMPDLHEICDNEWVLYVNYFGTVSQEKLDSVRCKYRRVIFDNTQAYFSPPIRDTQCFSVYSCRKFFGVSDGAYLVFYNDNNFEEYSNLRRAVSWKRSAFLMKSLEEGTNAAYKDSLENEEYMGTGLYRMSILTEKILGGIRYDRIREKRNNNLQVLKEELDDYNQITIPVQNTDLMIYPFLFNKRELRKELVERKIYVPQWWRYLLDIVPKDSVEYRYTEYLNPIPIDQRYDADDMMEIARLIKESMGDLKNE